MLDLWPLRTRFAALLLALQLGLIPQASLALAGPDNLVGEAGLRTLERIQDFLTRQPTRGEAEIDGLLLAELHTPDGAAEDGLPEEDRPAAGGVWGPLRSWRQLNAAEKKLVLRHPYRALQVNAAREEAIRETRARFTVESQANGNGDAFRHALWNALMVRRMSVEAAKDFADAHEEGSQAPAIHIEMDLFNNRVGRERAVWLREHSDGAPEISAYVESIEQAVNSGLLMRVMHGGLDWTDLSGRLLGGVEARP